MRAEAKRKTWFFGVGLSLRQLRRRLGRRKHAGAMQDCRWIVCQVPRHNGSFGNGERRLDKNDVIGIGTGG